MRLVTLLLLLLSTYCPAQTLPPASAPDAAVVIRDTFPKRLEVGITGGYLRHGVDFTPNANVETLGGNFYGVTLRYFDNPLVGFQAELSYVNAGWEEEIADTLELYRRETQYVELLILTQFSPGRGAVQPLLQAGPYLSAPIGDTDFVPAGYTPSREPVNEYYGRSLPFRLNYGVQAGVGLNLSIGPVTIQLDGRYLLGFNDLIRTRESQAVTSRREGIGGHIALFYALRR